MSSSRSLLQLLTLATIGSASTLPSPLDVQLEHFNGTTITAVITNTAAKAYNLLHRNSILDLDPSRKLHVSNHAHHDLQFHGIHKHNCADGDHEAPRANDFTAIAAGETLYRDIDVAGMYDLDAEAYEILAEGSLPYTEDGGLWLSGNAVPYRSNVLELPITSSQTAITTKRNADARKLRRRTTIDSSCSSDQNAVITSANQGCVALAQEAAKAAISGSAKRFETYFKDSSDATRQKVANVYKSVAKECAATPGGTSTSHCTDPYSYCSGNLIAYTYWSSWGSEKTRDVYYCPRYFEVMPQASSMCHSQSQASNTLHEMTHAMAETHDYAYGYDGIMGLSSEQAVANADTFALYASDLDLGCGDFGDDGGSNGSPWSGSPGSGQGNPWTGGQGSSDGSNGQGPPSYDGSNGQSPSASDGSSEQSPPSYDGSNGQDQPASDGSGGQNPSSYDGSNGQNQPASEGSSEQGSMPDCPEEQAPQDGQQQQGSSDGGSYSWANIVNWFKNGWGQSGQGQ